MNETVGATNLELFNQIIAKLSSVIDQWKEGVIFMSFNVRNLQGLFVGHMVQSKNGDIRQGTRCTKPLCLSHHRRLLHLSDPGHKSGDTAWTCRVLQPRLQRAHLPAEGRDCYSLVLDEVGRRLLFPSSTSSTSLTSTSLANSCRSRSLTAFEFALPSAANLSNASRRRFLDRRSLL